MLLELRELQYDFQQLVFDSKMMRLSLHLARLYVTTFSGVMQRCRRLKACFLALSADEQSSFHNGAKGLSNGFVFGIVFVAAEIKVSVILLTLLFIY